MFGFFLSSIMNESGVLAEDVQVEQNSVRLLTSQYRPFPGKLQSSSTHQRKGHKTNESDADFLPFLANANLLIDCKQAYAPSQLFISDA